MASIETIRKFGVIVTFIGLILLGSSLMFAPVPDTTVEYQTELNQTYLEDNHDTVIPGFIIDDEAQPDDVHPTYEYGNLTSYEQEIIDNIQTDRRVTSENVTTLDYGELIILTDENDGYIVEVTPDGFTPLDFSLMGFAVFLIGFIMLSQTKRADKELPESVEKSEEGEWKFVIKEE